MNGQLTARKLRSLLLVVMALVIAAMCGGFLYVHKNLVEYATTISQLNANANTGDQSIATLRNVEERLKDEKETQVAARAIIANGTTFADTVLGDVTRIAAESGVTLSSYEFVNTPTTGATGTTGAVAPAATPAPTAGGTSAPSAPSTTGVAAPAGVTKKSISVTLVSPVSYNNLMTFIRKVESNDLKLQIASVSLTKDVNGNVGTQGFSIGAYVR